jgi:hypothetical protein
MLTILLLSNWCKHYFDMRQSLIPPRAILKFGEILSFHLQDYVNISLAKWLFWQVEVADTTVYGMNINKEILRLPFDDFVKYLAGVRTISTYESR